LRNTSTQNVARLCDRQIGVAVDEHDLRTDAAHHHRISRGGADLSGSDDADFHAAPPLSRTNIRAKQRPGLGNRWRRRRGPKRSDPFAKPSNKWSRWLGSK
jgi:hypothetical protein